MGKIQERYYKQKYLELKKKNKENKATIELLKNNNQLNKAHSVIQNDNSDENIEQSNIDIISVNNSDGFNTQFNNSSLNNSTNNNNNSHHNNSCNQDYNNNNNNYNSYNSQTIESYSREKSEQYLNEIIINSPSRIPTRSNNKQLELVRSRDIIKYSIRSTGTRSEKRMKL